MKGRVKTWVFVGIFVFCVCLVVSCYMVLKQDLAVRAKDIEPHARSFQSIPEEWLAETSVGDEVAALVFYPNDSSDAVYSVYWRKGRSGMGYSFRAGGKISTVKDGVTRFSIDGCNESAYISLNTNNICKLIVDDGISLSTIPLDSSKPFAIVLPSNAGSIYFYDIEGKIMEITDREF